MTVRIEDDVLEQVAQITKGDSDKYARILLNLSADLRIDPEPSKQGWGLSSSRVGFLWQAGLKVRSLTLEANLPRHRFFYHFDEAHDILYIMEIAKRNRQTYDPMAPHIQRLKARYQEYYERKLWLQWQQQAQTPERS